MSHTTALTSLKIESKRPISETREGQEFLICRFFELLKQRILIISECSIVCVTEQHYFSIFFTRLWPVGHAL